MIVRALTGIVFIGVIIGSLLWSVHAVNVVFAIFLALGLHEFYKLFKQHERIEVSTSLGLGIGLTISALVIASFYQRIPFVLPMTAALPLIFTGLVSEIWRKKKEPILNSAIFVLGLIYVVLPFLMLMGLHSETSKHSPDSFPIVLGMFLLIWTNDTFAYLTGKFLGKTKLIERVSPNKTWEGTIGGVLFTLAVGATIGYFNDNFIFWIPAAAIIAPCAIIGDLFESVIKRNLGIKDSGNILPGHGGILDRFDATLIAVPFFFLWTLLHDLYL